MLRVRSEWIAWCSLVFCAGVYPTRAAAQAVSPQPSAAANKPAAASDEPAKPKAKPAKKAQAPVAPAPATAATGPAATAVAPVKAAEPAPSKTATADKPVLAAANTKPAAPPPPAATPAGASLPPPKPACTLAEAEQPRGGRLEVLSDGFGSAPVVRIAGKPARMIERRPDRVSVQVPADSDGGTITLLHDGKTSSCGNLTIIGKNR